MPQKISPFVEGKYGWNFGESGWNSGMDENLLKFSFLFDRNVDSITASLPPAVNGQAHFLTSDNRLYFAVGTTYFSTPTPKWFEFKIRSTGEIYQFNGTSVTQVASPSQFDSRLDAVEITLSSLGTAAFQDSDIFATQAKLDVAEANAANYTDVLRQELGSAGGASMVGDGLQILDSVSAIRDVSKNAPSDHVAVAGAGFSLLYKLDLADSVTEDDGIATIVASDGGRWKLVHNGSINVLAFMLPEDADHTGAFTRAAQFACRRLGVGIDIPAGDFYVSGNIPLTNTGTGAREDVIRVSFNGKGRSSRIIHTGDSHLFSATGLIYAISFSDFTVVNGRVGTNPTNAVFNFPDGNCDSDFTNIQYVPESGGGEGLLGDSFYVCGPGKVNDGVNFVNCYIYVNGTGIQLGAGSSVWVSGGRIVGSIPMAPSSSVGVRLTGGMGGVWLDGTDVIGHAIGVLSEQVGGDSNRELFLSQACIDSCGVGLQVLDSACYIDWIGVWAASCTIANIDFSPTSDAAILSLTGGTVFNAGVFDLGAELNYGISLNQFGKFVMQGTTVRNNKGRGISCNSAKSAITEIKNCLIFENGTAGRAGSMQVYLSGAVNFTGNTITPYSGVDGVTLDTAGSSLMTIRDNKGYSGFGLRPAPMVIGASGANVVNNCGQRLRAYLREGDVTAVWVNGNPVFVQAGGAVNASPTLNPGDSLRVDYTTAPNASWYFD